MIKILFINDYKTSGGAEQVVLQTIELLRDKYNIEYFYGNETPIQPKNIFEYIYSRKYYKLLLEKLNHIHPDIIHLTNYYHLLSPSILQAIKEYKQKNNTKVIMTTHDFHILAPNSGFTYFSWFKNNLTKIKSNPTLLDILIKKWDNRGFHYSITKQLQWIYAYKIKKLDKVIDHFISPSIFLADFLKDQYTNTKVNIIRNPLPKMNIKIIPRKQKNLDFLNILFIGRISTEKGLDKFIIKLNKIHTLNYQFTIIGDGDQLEDLKRLVQKLNLKNNILFKGRLSHIDTLNEMRTQDILVLPSIWYENAPLSLVEGAINRLQILTMNYGGMKEIAEICQNHYLLDENMTKLETGLQYLKNKKVIDNSNHIHSIFSLKNYINELEKVYHS